MGGHGVLQSSVTALEDVCVEVVAFREETTWGCGARTGAMGTGAEWAMRGGAGGEWAIAAVAGRQRVSGWGCWCGDAR